MVLLGIESSCDETSAAVVEDGRRILSNIVASQDEVHAPFGGVVPELASRQHLKKIGPVIDRALRDAGVSLDDIDALAVTQGPGLIGSLLVGVSFAKSIAYARSLPIVAVDHLEGHIRAVYVESPEPIPHPAISLVVSGGHTSLFLMEEDSSYELIGKTRDDAAGEAYDKVAKRLGLGYPGGPVIDRLARLGDASSFEFSLPRFSDGSQDFSFSGLKSAVLRAIQGRPVPALEEGDDAEARQDICDPRCELSKDRRQSARHPHRGRGRAPPRSRDPRFRRRCRQPRAPRDIRRAEQEAVHPRDLPEHQDVDRQCGDDRRGRVFEGATERVFRLGAERGRGAPAR